MSSLPDISFLAVDHALTALEPRRVKVERNPLDFCHDCGARRESFL